MKDDKAQQPLEREACMERARNLICGDRAEQYGDFKLNYGKTAQLISAITGVPISTGQVLLMLAGMKMARETTKHKQDNIDDAIGYLGLYSELMADDTALRNRQATDDAGCGRCGWYMCRCDEGDEV